MTNKFNLSWISAALVLLLTGCWQKSLNPFYTEKQLFSDSRLVGIWAEPQEGDKKSAVWKFTENGEKAYKLEIIDGEDRYEFDAHLFKLGNATLLDAYSRKRSVAEIPAHCLMKCELKDEGLELSILSIEWVRKWVLEHKNDISHLRVDDPEDPTNLDKTEIVLTAKTEELQKFVQAHTSDPGFFSDPSKLRRLKK